MRRRFALIHCKSYSSVVTFSFSSSSHWYKLSLSFLPLKDLLMPLEKYHSNPLATVLKKPDWTVLKSPHVGRSVLQLFMSGSHVLLPKLDNAVWILRQKLCKKTPPPRSSRIFGRSIQFSPAVSFHFQYENMGRRIEPPTRRRKMPHSYKSLSVLRVGI